MLYNFCYTIKIRTVQTNRDRGCLRSKDRPFSRRKELSFLELSEYRILDLLPEPALLLRGGAPYYANDAARRLLQELPPAEEDALPEPLAGLARRTEPFLQPDLTLETRTWSVQGIPGPDGMLLLLRPETAGLEPQLLGRISDSLRPPLSSLLSASTLLTGHVDEGGDVLLSTLNQQLFRLMRMAGNLSAARETLGSEGSFSPILADLPALCRKLTEAVNDVLCPHRAPVIFSSQRQQLVTMADVDLLSRMLLNLLSNALKASPEDAAVALTLDVRGDQAVLTVRDTGPGLPTDLLAEVFSPCTRTLRLDAPGQGLGLGLPLARAIALRHGGSLLLECPRTGGTAVTVSLPIRRERGPFLTDRRLDEPYGDFSRILVELSDILPPSRFTPQDVE